MNPTFEMALIGTVLADPVTMEIAGELAPQDFSGSNRTVWRKVLELHSRGALSARNLIEDLRATDDLDRVGGDLWDVGGEAYLQECHDRRGGQVEEYVRQVMDAATRRQLRDTAALIATEALDEGPIDELLDEAEKRVMGLRRSRGVTGVTMAQILSAFMPHLEGMRTGAIVPSFVPKLAVVKDVIDYIDENDFVLVAGRPGDGKSSYLRFEAFHQCKTGRPCLFFNLENTEGEYAKQWISLDTGIDSHKLRSPRLLSRAEYEQVKESAERLARMPLEVVTLGSPSVAEIDRLARTRMRTLKPQFIMVDYVQCISNSMSDRVQDVSLTSQVLRAMGMKNRLNVPIIAACQLSRAIELRGGASEPQLSDLRESGSLEQDATMVLFPRETKNNALAAQFPENRDHEGRILPMSKAVVIKMFIRKNRNGPIGVTPDIKWTKSTGNYQSLVQER